MLNLEYKNIKRLEDVLSNLLSHKKIKRLNLSGNKLRYLPKDLSFLKQLKYIDLSSNPITRMQLVVDGLSSLPNLRSLSLDFNRKSLERDFSLILGRLRKLKFLNGFEVERVRKNKDLLLHKDKDSEINERTEFIIRNSELKQYSVVVDCLSLIFGDKDKKQGFEVGRSLTESMKAELMALGKKITPEMSTAEIQWMNLGALFNLYTSLFEPFTRYLDKHVDERLGDIARFIRDSLVSCFKGLSEVHKKSSADLPWNSGHSLFSSSLCRVGSGDSFKRHVDVSVQKMVTVPQLHEFIEEIYESKLKEDLKNLSNKLPRKTMEEHTQVVFHNKFGLKELTFDNFYSFLSVLKKNSKDDLESLVFLKILRNELEEEFRFAVAQIREVLKSLLKVFIYGSMPKAQETTVKAIWEKKLITSITKTEAIQITHYLYSAHDSEVLRDKISKQDGLSLSYSTFEFIVLGYIVESHDLFLKPFLVLFRALDPERTGILTMAKFTELVRKIDESKKFGFSTAKLLERVDPFSTDRISFSLCVTFLSNIIVEKDSKMSLLCELHRGFHNNS